MGWLAKAILFSLVRQMFFKKNLSIGVLARPPPDQEKNYCSGQIELKFIRLSFVEVVQVVVSPRLVECPNERMKRALLDV